jgi:membrane protease subunit HflK
VEDVELQEVQPPRAVREAFDDVLAASQDRNRAVNEAEGYANEVVPRARGEASELIAGAQGYREAKIAEATGAAARFLALAAEYEKAPAITRKRLYLETMEAVLPEADKLIVEPGSGAVLPYLPLGPGSGGEKR